MVTEIFKKEIIKILSEAKKQGLSYIDLVSGDIHRKVGGYPSNNHRMPSCCKAMYSLMKPGDEVLYAPQKGKGATLKIRYYINEEREG